jgi:hypothetical protein
LVAGILCFIDRMLISRNLRLGRLLLALLASLLFAMPDAQADEGARRALLIGVNKYQQLPWLGGSRNDVALIRSILVDRYGFDEQHITTLLDEDATRSAILEALESLVATAGPEDTVFVHYSGHGSQVRDLDGDEADGLDETICPTDARTEGIPDITDDELGRILGRLDVSSAVIVLDSCHSGTALRAASVDVRARSVPMDTRVELYDDEKLVSRGVVPAPGAEPYVLFSAAAPHQQELDGPFGPEGKRLGLLTAALSRAFEALDGDVSPQELLSEVERNVEKIKPMFAGHPVPEAQLEGQLVLIERPLFSPIDGTPPTSGLFSPTNRPHGGRKRIFVSGEERQTLLRNAPADLVDRIDWTDSRSEADAVIECGDGGRCDVFGPNGTVHVASLSPVEPRIASVAATADSVAELLSVDETSGAIDLSLSATGRPQTQAAPVGTRGIKLTAAVDNHQISFYDPSAPRTYRNSLQLTVSTDVPCYLTLVSIDSAGNVLQLLPNPIQQQARFIPDGYLQANQNYLIPDSLEAGNRAGFYMDYAPPAGTDTVRAICTSSSNLAEEIRSDIGDISLGRVGVSIAQTLVSARGLTDLRPGESDEKSGAWGTATITIDIATP